MNVFVTGHTSGLGKALYNLCNDADYNVTGLSRSNGYDLNNLEDFLLQDNWDVFINNAYAGWAQTDLLYKLFDQNKNRKCTIINIGSVSADGNYDTVNQYAVHKAALDKACTQLQLIDSECKIVQVKLGRMDTPLVAHKTARKMSPSVVGKYILDTVIHNASDDMLVKNLTVDIMNSRRPL